MGDKAGRVVGREEEAEKALGRLQEAPWQRHKVLSKKPGSMDSSKEKELLEGLCTGVTVRSFVS